MRKARVTNAFRDRTGRYVEPGEVVEGSVERIERLERMGCVRPLPTEPPRTETARVSDRPEPKHLGGGWYELADGTRVQGKKAAEEAAGQ